MREVEILKKGRFDLAAFHLGYVLQLKIKYILAKKIGYLMSLKRKSKS